ncbi:hypothetical protein Tco_0794140 [Tanacetum coccineum]
MGKKPNLKSTQSVGLLSYTFLLGTGQDDVIVPMKELAIRENRYVWLGDLLIEEIDNDGDSILSNIKNLQKRITLASVKDYSPELDIPLPV